MTPHDKFILNQALDYLKMGFSVIPLTTSKIPHKGFSLETYLYKKPTEKQVTEWFSGEFTGSNIGLCMGPSGKAVLDLDLYRMDDDEKQGARELFKGIITPTASSPRGGVHYYFNDHPDLISKSGILKGFPNIDCKTRGGYIVAPPSVNGKGTPYQWLKNKHIAMISTIDIPNNIISIINKDYVQSTPYGEGNRNKTQQTTTNATLNLNEGNRDQALFHIASCLTKGGMQRVNIQHLLQLIASKLCVPPFPPKEVNIKVQSALQRLERKIENLTQALREYVNVTWGNFSVTNAQQEITNVTYPEQRAKIRVILGRLVEKGIIEKVEGQNGWYRKVEETIYQDWMGADIDSIDVQLPFGMEQYVTVYPGDLIVYAGVKNSGKTALALETIRLNRYRFNCYYHSSEIVRQTFKLRISKYKDIEMGSWKDVKMSRGLSMLNAKDRVVKDALNVFDYIEADDGEYYKISSTMSRIHRELGDGIAIVCLQKSSDKKFARGGEGTKDKASLYATIDKEYPYHVLRIDECKTFKEKTGNPTGYFIKYKIAGGVNLLPAGALGPEMED